jgi:hypothetical protein
VSKAEQIMQKEMTRREFLLAMGVAAASLVGLSAILGLFTKPTSSVQNGQLQDYGMQRYGP